jgi:hypothetical protein
MPGGYHRDRGVYLARHAAACAGAREPEQAVSLGTQALRIAQDTGSGRIVDALAQLDSRLQQWEKTARVVEFRASFNDILLHETASS